MTSLHQQQVMFYQTKNHAIIPGSVPPTLLQGCVKFQPLVSSFSPIFFSGFRSFCGSRYATGNLQDGNVKSATTQIIDGQNLSVAALVVGLDVFLHGKLHRTGWRIPHFQTNRKLHRLIQKVEVSIWSFFSFV